MLAGRCPPPPQAPGERQPVLALPQHLQEYKAAAAKAGKNYLLTMAAGAGAYGYSGEGVAITQGQGRAGGCELARQGPVSQCAHQC